MADAFDTVLLNNGLDYIVPPLLSKPGTLTECLNYEMSTHIGYQRIDGYERRDGWPTGGIARFYQIEITEAFAGSLVGAYAVGSVLYSDWATDQQTIQGIVVNVGPIVSGKVVVRYVPADNTLKLQVGRKVGSSNDTISVASTDGRTIVTDPNTYLGTIRAYSVILRNLVRDADHPIAGLTYSRDRHYEAQNTMFIKVYDAGGQVPRPGDWVRFRGRRYKFVGVRYPTDSNPNFKGEWHFIPTTIAAVPNNNDIVSLSSPGPGTYATNQTGTFTDADSWMAFMTCLNSPNISSIAQRERRTLHPATSFDFVNGNTPGDADGPAITGKGASVYYVTDSGGFTLIRQVVLTQVVQQGGNFTTNTATGRMQVVTNFDDITVRSYLQAGDEIHTSWPTTGTSRVATVGAANSIFMAQLAGTGALRAMKTRYQWGTYNFYASPNFAQLYGANGVYRAFWVDSKTLLPGTVPLVSGFGAYGNIVTQSDAALDNPKYLTFHAGVQLGLGFEDGSFQLSVGGVPYDFEGVRGALEIATGDDITGVLEGVNDSSLIFGKRSIRRVTGTTDNTIALETISANAGALDYTCVNVGSIPTFTGPTGISTLAQAQEYGDFLGERASSLIYTFLNPKLVPDQGTIESAGVACALPVRAKQQYRLFLNTGDVISVTFTEEGPKCMRSSYQNPGQAPRIPLAWSSSVGDSGKEYIEVVWDEKLGAAVGNAGETTAPNTRAYLLDNGWGFDGEVFTHYFDVCWRFPSQGTSNVTVQRVRMHGLGYGVAPLDVKSSALETDYMQAYTERIQDISMPVNAALLYDRLTPVTSIIDQANWGLGIKIRMNGTVDFSGGTIGNTTPPHICQVLQMYVSTGVGDNR